MVETNLTFVKSHSKSITSNKYKQNEIIQMLDFFMDNIFVLFGGRVFQQTIGNPMGRIGLRYSPISFDKQMKQTSFMVFSRIKV